MQHCPFSQVTCRSPVQRSFCKWPAFQCRNASIPDQLKEFLNSTERLITLRERLLADIRQYNDAAALKRFDQEAANITDQNTTKNMTLLRRKTEEDTNDRKQEAAQTVALFG